MSRLRADTCQRFLKAKKLQEGMLNRMEAVVRAFDPCLNYATHAVGNMPLEFNYLTPKMKFWTTFYDNPE